MNQEKIQFIKLNRFRGATQELEIKFDPKKSVVMIFGENGTGKSTLVDAMDFIFNEECGSLKEKSSTKIKNHLPSIGSNYQDVKVFISSQNNKWEGRLNGSNPEINGNEYSFSLKILRRSKVLELVNAEPKKRYEALKNFIELPKIRSSENSLRDCIKEIKRDIDSKTATNEDQKNTLKTIWEQEDKPENNCLDWANKISLQNNEELKNKIENLKKYIESEKRLIECWNQFEKLNIEFSESEEKLTAANNKLQEISNENQPKKIIDVLEETQSFLEKQKPNECPVCEQSIDPEKLKQRISVRLNNIKDLKVSTENYQKEESQHKILKRDFLKQKNKLKNSTNELIDNPTNSKIPEKYQFLIEDQFDFEQAKSFFKTEKPNLKKLENDLAKKQKISNQLNSIKTNFVKFNKFRQEIQKLNNKKKFLEKILKVVEKERKTYVENILNNISGDVEDLYSKLHPKEGLDNIKLYLKPNVQGSLEIESSFQEKTNIPPQAYFSDSHLDTLGVCVFIAMTKYFNDDIIVLDDLLTSVDQPHIERFIEMLHDEAQHFNQVIITTHYRPWREKYKFHRKSNSNIQLIELSPFWSLQEGIKSNQTKLSIEELKILQCQVPFDRQISGSKSGIFLESLLDHLTLLYGLSIPRKPVPNYTLGELLNSFSDKFKKNMKIKYKDQNEIQLSNIINELSKMANPIRNQVGCHWNDSGVNISDHEVMYFLKKTIEFGNMIICKECKGLPGKKETDCWKCSCKETSLYPLGKL